MVKKFLKKITGIAQIEEHILSVKAEAEASINAAKQAAEEAEKAKQEAEKAKQEEALSKLSPKERSSELGEPYVAVLHTHVNKDNLRNGFFELDWNDEFIVQLKQEGYGSDGDIDEEIVDRWFRALCSDVAYASGINAPERAGYINVKKLIDNKSEIS